MNALCRAVRRVPARFRLLSTEAKIADLGHTLPHVTAPKGTYVLANRTGNLVFTAGHLPQTPHGDGTDAPFVTGKVGDDLDVNAGYRAAQYAALSLMATLKHEVGDLDKVRFVKLVGFVNSTNDFVEQPAVINGASDLIGEVFGARGAHARSAVGVNTLPLNVCVEIEAIVEVLED